MGVAIEGEKIEAASMAWHGDEAVFELTVWFFNSG